MGRIPAAYTLHELTHLIGAFTWHKRPVGSPTVDFIEEKKVKLPSGLLLLSQYQLFGCGISATTIGFDRNDFHIKEQQDALLWPSRQTTRTRLRIARRWGSWLSSSLNLSLFVEDQSGPGIGQTLPFLLCSQP